MMLDENKIKELPIITEEEIRDCYKGDEFQNECLAAFDEAVKNIESEYADSSCQNL